MARCLKVPSEKFRDKLKTTLDDYMTTMTRELATLPSRADVKARFLRHCEAVLGVTAVADQPTAAEEAAITEMEATLSDPSGRSGRAISSSNWASRSPPGPISPKAPTRRRAASSASIFWHATAYSPS